MDGKTGGRRRALLALGLGLCLALTLTAPAAAQMNAWGRWVGTVSLSSNGTRTYKQHYRGTSGPENVMGSSAHSLSWRYHLDAPGSYSCCLSDGSAWIQWGVDDPSAPANAEFEQFSWSGTVSGNGSTPQGAPCTYEASATFNGPLSGRVASYPQDFAPSPRIDTGDVTGTVDMDRPEGCNPGIVTGFGHASFDDLLFGQPGDPNRLNNQTALCSPWLDDPGPDLAEEVTFDADGRPQLKLSKTTTCSGPVSSWFGDSDLTQDDVIAVTYSYDLRLAPDGPTDCNDGRNNDNDGLVDDGEDPGCISPLDPSELANNECDNGKDDDGDGKWDWPADTNCASAAGTKEGGPCADGKSNDFDGIADYPLDPGCSSAADTSELGTNECDNGRDDDRDGRIDWPLDADCDGVAGTHEKGGCAVATAKDRHYTTLDVPTRLNVAAAPDPDLGSLHMGIPWCMTSQGPQIMTRPDTPSDPYGWWVGTDNWVLLGALESFAGITVDAPPTPRVEHGRVTARVTTSLNAHLDAADLILSVIPVGKLFKPLKKGLGKYADDLNPLAKKLDRFHGKVVTATKKMEKSGAAVRDARAHVAEVRGWVAQAEDAVKAAKTAAERSKAKEQLADLKELEQRAKRVERIKSLEYQDDIRELRRVKSDEEAAARKVDKVLKKIRKLDDEIKKFKSDIRTAIDKHVDAIRPKWARNVVRGFVDDIDGAVKGPVDTVTARLKKLTSDKLVEILKKGSATSSVLGDLKSTYTKAVKGITSVPVPVWTGDLTVSFDQKGKPSVADNSDSHGIFTVETEPALRTR